MSRTPERADVDSPVIPPDPVDLWLELERLGRADRAVLAARWDEVRRARFARRSRPPHPPAPAYKIAQ